MNTVPNRFFFSFVLLASLTGGFAQAINEGIPARNGEFPAVFGFKYDIATPGSRSAEATCSAFLVHPRLLLTAAHCVKDAGEIRSLSNSVVIGGGKSHPVQKHGSKPGWRFPVDDSDGDPAKFAYNRISASTDIGYLLLKKEIVDVDPLAVRPSKEPEAMQALRGLDATLFGYGATSWQSVLASLSGTGISFMRNGKKHHGRKQITKVDPMDEMGSVHLDGVEFGALPGDSGGPLLATVDGTEVAIALNHRISIGTRPRMKKNGKASKTEMEKTYEATIATLLSKPLLCWVEQDSGIRFTDLDCSN